MTSSEDNHPFADGFLSEAVNEVKAHVHQKYKPLVELAYVTNRRAVTLQHELNIHLEDLSEKLGAAFYARTIAFTQASMHLLERGMPTQARTVLRAGLESMFPLAALAKDRNLAARIVESHDADRRSIVDRISRWTNPTLRASIEAGISEVEMAAISGTTGKSTSVFDYAKLADMEEWYLTIYLLLSFSAHSKLSDLDRHIVVNDDGVPIEFRNEPDISKQEAVWGWSIEVQTIAMRSVGAIFSMDVSDVENLRDRLAKIAEPFGVNGSDERRTCDIP